MVMKVSAINGDLAYCSWKTDQKACSAVFYLCTLLPWEHERGHTPAAPSQ